MNEVPLSQFLRRGALAACLIGLGLGILAGLGFGASIAGAHLVLLAVIGPVPRLLIALDVSNGQLMLLSAAAILPYWLGLGSLAGWMCWTRCCATGERPDEGDLRHCTWRRIPVIVTVFAVFGAVILASSPNVVGGGPSARNIIVSNLRQLDGAKDALAIDRSLLDGHTVTEAELFNYLKQPFPGKQPWGERYVLNTIGTTPYAIVDADYRVRRRGWREGYWVRAGTVVRLDD